MKNEKRIISHARSDPSIDYVLGKDGKKYTVSDALDKKIDWIQIDIGFLTEQQKETVLNLTKYAVVNGSHTVMGEIMGEKALIIRTAWLYSSHGNNFVKTMIRLMGERPSLNVVGDQIGAPTYAADLAAAIMHIVAQKIAGNKHSGIYHFSNSGAISWYDFAMDIKGIAQKNCEIKGIPASSYPTPAERPAFSLLDKSGEASSQL